MEISDPSLGWVQKFLIPVCEVSDMYQEFLIPVCTVKLWSMDQKFLIPVSKTLDMDQKFLILAYKPSDISRFYRQGSEISYPYPRLHSTDRDQILVCEALNMDQNF